MIERERFIEIRFTDPLDPKLKPYFDRRNGSVTVGNACQVTDGAVALLIGVNPLRSARSARWMQEKLFGTIIPDAMIARLEAAMGRAADRLDFEEAATFRDRLRVLRRSEIVERA